MRFQKQRAGIVREAKKNEQNNKSIGGRGDFCFLNGVLHIRMFCQFANF